MLLTAFEVGPEVEDLVQHAVIRKVVRKPARDEWGGALEEIRRALRS